MIYIILFKIMIRIWRVKEENYFFFKLISYQKSIKMANDIQNRISFYQNVAETKDSLMKRFLLNINFYLLLPF